MNFKSNKRKSTFLNVRKYFSLILVVCLWGIIPQLKAQSNSSGESKTVKGIVLDELNEPMIGVTIMEKGTKNGSITDFNGRFQLKVASSAAKLIFTYIGYASKEVSLGTSDLRVQLLPDSKQIEEVVVVGYAQQSKKSVVGAISQTSGEALKSKGAVSNLTDALNGSIPGVTVMTRSGAPGSSGQHSDAPEILIRGLSTWNNSSPLILVDGVERLMSDINVDEIENFSVLKDASATAVFGVKGANGVILITSKRGTLGKPKITAEVNLSLKSLSKIESPMDSYDGLLARNYAVVNEMALDNDKNMRYYTSPRILDYYRNGLEPEKYTNVNWKEVMLRDQAFSSKYNVNVQGGTDFVRYFTSVAYLKDGDIMKTDMPNPRGYSTEFKYQRVNFRTNLDFTLTKTTTFKVNLSGYYGRQQEPATFANQFWDGLYKYTPNVPLPVYEDGTYGMDHPDMLNSMGKNFLYSLQTAGVSVSKRTALTSDFELEQKLDFITKGLSAKARFSFDNYFSTTGGNLSDPSSYVRKRFDFTDNKWVYLVPQGGGDGFDFQAQPLGYSKESNSAGNTRRNMYYEAAINYKRSFGKHNVGGLALFSRQEQATGSAWPSKREDWVGRVTYDYDGKYLFETNAAYNGSELFLKKFDFFPSFAFGWRVSEEPFIKNNVPQISNLKIRYSIGWVGSDNLSGVQWGYLTTWDAGGAGFSNAVQAQGPSFGSGPGKSSIYVGQSFKEGPAGNPLLGWESARKQNYGVEFGFFKDLITGSVDYFNDYRYDMLIPASQRVSVPGFIGHPSPAVNAGEVNISGLEIELKFRKKIQKAVLWAGYTWTLAKSNILYAEDPELLPDYQKREGFRLNQTKTTVTTELIDSWDKMYTGVLSDNNTSKSNTLTGSYRFNDFNADGVINSNDNIPWGYVRQPQNTYGFSFGADYKGFSVMTQFYGLYNTTIEGSILNEELMYNFPVIFENHLSRTATPEYGVEDPTFRAIGMAYRGGQGQYNRLDASLLRLKTLQISYELPKSWLKSLSIENLRFFVNGNNLFIWTKLPIDTEGKDLNNITYPNTRNINFGMNVTL